MNFTKFVHRGTIDISIGSEYRLTPSSQQDINKSSDAQFTDVYIHHRA